MFCNLDCLKINKNMGILYYTRWGRKAFYILYSKKIDEKKLYRNFITNDILCELCFKNNVLKVAPSSCDTLL